MQLVIDIPEETVNEIKDNAMFASSISSDIRWDVTSAIVNGTPLDDVKAEINQLPSYVAKFAGGSFAIHIDKEGVLQIISKNLAESEGK